ncbi:MAG: hypothetical protein JRJ44_06890 [Deltaproteobacteria bacterium]|nr:hypothetical protein [Deltaproteobacteria bacterium]
MHPGTIGLKDNIGIAVTLYEIVNFIADAMITKPKAIDNMYKNLPENKIKQIAVRDKDKQH